MFEVGKLTDEVLDSFLEELDKVCIYLLVSDFPFLSSRLMTSPREKERHSDTSSMLLHSETQSNSCAGMEAFHYQEEICLDWTYYAVRV